MRQWLIAVLASVVWLGPAAAARAEQVRVIGEHAMVYERPDAESSLMRLLYLGEILEAVEEASAPDASRWIKVKLGERESGYVRAEKLGKPTTVPVKPWAPPTILRDDRPLVIGARIEGETLGAAINVRYQPFTRLGLSFSQGGVFEYADGLKYRGTATTFGIYSCLVLWNLSPLIEVGLALANYTSGQSNLQLFNFYFNFGLEWMSSWGGFVAVYGSYVHSLTETVTFDYRDARAGQLQIGTFGTLEPKNGSFVTLRPGLTIGYAF